MSVYSPRLAADTHLTDARICMGENVCTTICPPSLQEEASKTRAHTQETQETQETPNSRVSILEMQGSDSNHACQLRSGEFKLLKKRKDLFQWVAVFWIAGNICSKKILQYSGRTQSDRQLSCPNAIPSGPVRQWHMCLLENNYSSMKAHAH